MHPVDGRVLFAHPWGDRTYIGTTDTDYQGDPAEVCATTASDVDYLLAAANAYFPTVALRGDVISTWAGLRPLIAPPSRRALAESSGQPRALTSSSAQDGLITIAGGKLTTYRRMAAEVVDTAVKLLRLGVVGPGRTSGRRHRREPLPGAVGWPEDDDHGRVGKQVEQVASEGLVDAVIARGTWSDTYGTRAHRSGAAGGEADPASGRAAGAGAARDRRPGRLGGDARRSRPRCRT
jgi:glycerol-3-phosphate dehydrogenase